MGEPSLRIREKDGGIEVALHVQPRARRSGIEGLHGDALRVRVTAPPVDDAANDAVIDFFASLLKIARSRLRIVSGLRSRAKTLRIEGMHRGEFIEGLEPPARRECAGIER